MRSNVNAWARLRPHRRVPYIYSAAEIKFLVAQARLTIRSRLRASTIETLFELPN
jgi:hypothetical protein